MRILYMANNRLGWKVLEWLRRQPEAELVALAVHPPDRRLFGDEILADCGLDEEDIFDASQLESPGVLERIAALEPELGVSVLLGYILRPRLLGLLPSGCVNLHPSLLPHNRGAHSNVWAIVDGTPAGASLHWIDAGVDTGDLIAQREVEVEPIDTGKSLYHKLERAGLTLFQECWPALAAGNAPRRPQPSGAGSSHRRRDLESLDEIHLDEPTTARRVIDTLRARTFPPYPGAYFVQDGRKVFLRLELSYDDDD
jgi:methionyl-tRNA formyltransferase